MPFFSSNNRRLFYREEGQGPLLLVLPGNTASSANYEAELAYFGRHYHAVSFDFLGTGQSERLERWPDDWWERGAYDALALVHHLREKECLVMGTSGGGVVALMMAILFPKQVQAVVADSCVERFSPEGLRAEVAVRQQRPPELVGFWQYAHGDDWQQVVEADSNLLLRIAEGSGDWAGGRLKAISCPVLLTASLRDQSLPDVREQIGHMVEQIPKGTAFLVNEGDHPFMWSNPEYFRRMSNCFLKMSLR
jgi:pimeloyl-ACP methyl ester carboxylesterase